MKTPLYSILKERGAKFFNFNGWDVPLEFTSIKEESLIVRNSCGMFDISHMGRILVKGKDVLEKLNYLTTNDLNKLYPGRVQYNLLSNERGGVIDDITIYMISQEELFLCVNAANKERVLNHIKSYVDDTKDLSQDTIQIAIQGPKSQSLLSRYFDVESIKYYHFKIFGDIIVSRTGYTGEDGFEVYAPVDKGLELFRSLADEAALCGFGARDVLRIEAGFPLYGKELNQDITPLEANLKRFVSLDKDFLGKESMLRKPIKRMLFGLELLERGVPRQGYPVLLEGKSIGYVSSGTYSYYLNKGIALCFLDVEHRKQGTPVELEIRNKRFRALLRTYPFVKKGTS